MRRIKTVLSLNCKAAEIALPDVMHNFLPVRMIDVKKFQGFLAQAKGGFERFPNLPIDSHLFELDRVFPVERTSKHWYMRKLGLDDFDRLGSCNAIVDGNDDEPCLARSCGMQYI